MMFRSVSQNPSSTFTRKEKSLSLRTISCFNPDVGYTSPGSLGYQSVEASWMNSWVNYQGYYERTKTIVGVSYVYRRVVSHSTITIAGTIIIMIHRKMFVDPLYSAYSIDENRLGSSVMVLGKLGQSLNGLRKFTCISR